MSTAEAIEILRLKRRVAEKTRELQDALHELSVYLTHRAIADTENKLRGNEPPS